MRMKKDSADGASLLAVVRLLGVRERKGAIVRRPKEGTAPKSEGFAGKESSLLARSECQLARKV